ncbi:hypothetical protein EHQ82_11005 [Leptospira selangorensis]|uniref:DUF3592 domain-containing protein n=1 Tax=Leptospira selangorensis TaxID=2484982 RepID=A0ABY2N9P8_9LEPT|nr:hypothetical protein [Leptospira selangorensis]TGM19053.1 hypothetical protein EHQ82_11005 [Leptospira selangorensis]
MHKLSKKRFIGKVFGSLVLILIGVFLITLTIIEVMRYTKLSNSKQLQRIVTNKRTHSGSKGIRSYDIQYEFFLGDNKYTGSDATGRENLWIGIPKEFFDALEINSKIPIAYSLENPNVNRPIVSPIGIGDTIAGGILGLFFFSFGFLLFLGLIQDFLKRKAVG